MDEKVFISHSTQPGKQKRNKRKPVMPIAAAVILIAVSAILGGCSKSPEDEGIAAVADATETSEPTATPEPEEPAEETKSAADDGAVQESIEELLGLVEQAEELVKQANAEVDGFADLEDFTEKTISISCFRTKCWSRKAACASRPPW